MAIILDGKLLSATIKSEILEECKALKENYSIIPSLAIVLVGNDPASQIYVASKERLCGEVGIRSIVVKMDENSTQDEVELKVKMLASDPEINGLMVQLPLPKGLDEDKVLANIPPNKDVDGLTPLSGGYCLFDYDGFTPCTPKGIIEILKRYNIPLSGKHAVVIGRSNMVGKPVALKLLRENCTVTICHSRTQNLDEVCKTADILVVAVGKKHLVTENMIKDGAVVIDVGINRVDGKLYGDVDFEGVSNRASYITPVPGGVGPMTVAMLISNTLTACKKQNNI
ncbi:MAG: bifunctional methylenetetrahydrofolate dehydrogenase/methenyltetrahydrofolate cyclohydrolase FolD [Clostridia bacterium]|nr:bifunctional methylenetetrahydrofolate dehydrogenase/methenyltetrahydrofolate cyclohydrolase FolD [Clostridia bacterium]